MPIWRRRVSVKENSQMVRSFIKQKQCVADHIRRKKRNCNQNKSFQNWITKNAQLQHSHRRRTHWYTVDMFRKNKQTFTSKFNFTYATTLSYQFLLFQTTGNQIFICCWTFPQQFFYPHISCCLTLQNQRARTVKRHFRQVRLGKFLFGLMCV